MLAVASMARAAMRAEAPSGRKATAPFGCKQLKHPPKNPFFKKRNYLSFKGEKKRKK